MERKVIHVNNDGIDAIARAVIRKFADECDIRDTNVIKVTVGFALHYERTGCEHAHFIFEGIIYWNADHTEVTDVVPIWWEFATGVRGEYFQNDFCFAAFKEYFIKRYNYELNKDKVLITIPVD